jgi:uncharacterized damage-inducible protein DinB
MMTAGTDLLVDAFGRVREAVEEAVAGLGPDELAARLDDEANSIGWLVWHLTRIQDDHVAELLGEDQLWASGEWAGQFGLHTGPSDTGYGHSAAQVAGVRPESAQVLLDYFDAVAARTREFLRGLTPDDLDRVVDERWDPPVTLGVRLVSIVDDDVQHAGQAAYVRGLLPSG